jgi:catechol 2,3-dioxygenase-like lactoylglutathione lyase family enzyme
MSVVHHSAICVTDVEESLRFWHEAMGFEVLMDHNFSADWPTLFNVPSSDLRAIFLGDPSNPDSGIVELIDLQVTGLEREENPTPRAGFMLLSVMTDVAATLERLAKLGLGGVPRRLTVSGVSMAVIHDPDGVMIELFDTKASSNLEALRESDA